MRHLCLEQRVRFANTFALSKLWYVAKVVPPLKQAVQGLRSHVGQFVWRGHFFRVPFPVLCSSIGEGGFGLHDPVLPAQSLFYSKWRTSLEELPDTFSAALLDELVETSLQQPDNRLLRAPSKSHFAHYATTLKHLPPHDDILGRRLIDHTYRTILPILLPRRVRVEDILPNTEWQQVWRTVQSRTSCILHPNCFVLAL